MSTGYVRQAAGNISSGLAIRSADINAEYNQLQSAFDNTTGHDHSGSVTGDGAKIPLASAVSGVLPVANGGTGSASSYLSCPNLLINSAMEIDQANEGVSVTLATGVNKYIVDGWSAGFTNATAAVSAQRVSDAPTGAVNSLKLTVGTGAVVAAGSLLLIQQLIEGANLTATNFGTASAATLSLSFYVKSSIAAYTASGSINNAAFTRSYPFNFAITNSGTWEQKTVVIPGDIAGAWVTSGSAAGMVLTIAAAVGSNFQGTANTWAAANYEGTSSNTNTILSTNGATFQMTQAKLEISPSVTIYARRSVTSELIECQRYYEKSYSFGVAVAAVDQNGAEIISCTQDPGNGAGYSARFKVAKRAAPTIVGYSPVTGTVNKIADRVNIVDVTAVAALIGTNGFLWRGTPSAGNNATLMMHWTADARL